VPSLRERAEDIPALAGHYLSFFAGRQARGGLAFSAPAVEAMSSHRWPGNLRELRNAIERAVILSAGAMLEPSDLGLASHAAGTKEVQVGALVSLEDLERAHIAHVIAKAPTLEAAARILGIDATTVSRKRKRYGLV
jgi:NtrC-family two-component system response regulator AlgB